MTLDEYLEIWNVPTREDYVAAGIACPSDAFSEAWWTRNGDRLQVFFLKRALEDAALLDVDELEGMSLKRPATAEQP